MKKKVIAISVIVWFVSGFVGAGMNRYYSIHRWPTMPVSRIGISTSLMEIFFGPALQIALLGMYLVDLHNGIKPPVGFSDPFKEYRPK